MAKSRAGTANREGFRCGECGWTTVKWVGRCGECQAWGTVSEAGGVSAVRTAAVAVAPAPAIGEVDTTEQRVRPTGVGEFDRVLGGGLVPGAVILLAGEPGIGKSTLALDVAARAARAGDVEGFAHGPVLYVSGEESAAQVRMRAERIEAMARTLHLAAETDLGSVLGQVEALQPSLLVIDSVQTLASADIEGAAGNVGQVREVAAAIIRAAKARAMPTILIGHVTKDGSIAGPRVLEHLVDVVVGFEGERHSPLRMVRAVKNRYGATDEVGCFELSDAGITGLPDPSGVFVSSRDHAAVGSAVTVTLEGRRPLVAEVQALLAPRSGGSPRRTTSGLDSARLAMLLAVLGQRAGIPVHDDDCYASTVGGVRLSEPAVDLALAVALGCSKSGIALPASTVVLGEVGLTGDVRAVPSLLPRLREAHRIGFRRALIPQVSFADAVAADTGLQLVPLATVADAVELVHGPGPRA